MLFQLSFDEFIKKAKLWCISKDSLHKIIYELSGDNIIFYLSTPEEVFCSVMDQKEITKMQAMEVFPMSIPGRRITEMVKIDEVSIESLKNATNQPSDIG